MLEDFIKIIHSSSFSDNYRQIGEGLGVDVEDLSSYGMPPMNKLILVFQRWIHSANNVTWGKVLKVFNDNPSIFPNASTKLIEFLISEEEQSNTCTMIDSITDKELLEKLGKEALQEDFIKIFYSSSNHYAAIGVGLGVDVEDLMTRYAHIPSVNKLILVFKRCRDSNNDITWGKILKVCKDYPKELHNAETKLIWFLKSDKEQSNTMIPGITEELLKEEPLQEHFIKIFHSSSRVSDHYAVIGVGLGVEVNDLIEEYSDLSSLYKLILVFQRWMDSYNNVTWEKIIKVCEDYPKELLNARNNLIQFLKEEQINSMTDNELLKKNPSHRDLLKIFHSSSDHYAVIGVGLGVNVSFLILGPNARLELVNKLMFVFELWISSDKNVTWGKILKVCGDYPKELSRAKAKLKEFLLSEEAQKYLERELNIKIPDASAFDEGHQIVDQEDVERSHTVFDLVYAWSENYIVLIVIAILAVIISFLYYMYNLRQNN